MTQQRSERTTACLEGNHRAKRVRLLFEGGQIQSKCRDCGCDLVRTQATRRWYYSGRLGFA